MADSSEAAKLKARHDALKLKKREWDRSTTDLRIKHKAEKRAGEMEINEVAKRIDESKAPEISEEEKLAFLKKEVELQEKAADELGDAMDDAMEVKRKAKQKMQVQEHDLVREKIAMEKLVDEIEHLRLAVKQVEEDVRACEAESEQVQNEYDEMTATIKEAKDRVHTDLSKVKEKAKAAPSKQVSDLEERLQGVLTRADNEKHAKAVLIERLEFDTARLVNSIPRITSDLEVLRKLKK